MEKYTDKLYELIGNKTPVVNRLPARHSRKTPLLYFDAEKGYQEIVIKIFALILACKFSSVISKSVFP